MYSGLNNDLWGGNPANLGWPNQRMLGQSAVRAPPGFTTMQNLVSYAGMPQAPVYTSAAMTTAGGSIGQDSGDGASASKQAQTLKPPTPTRLEDTLRLMNDNINQLGGVVAQLAQQMGVTGNPSGVPGGRLGAYDGSQYNVVPSQSSAGGMSGDNRSSSNINRGDTVYGPGLQRTNTFNGGGPTGQPGQRPHHWRNPGLAPELARQLPRWPQFDGTTDIDLYLDSFQERASLSDITEIQLVQMLRQCLTGKALEFKRSLGPAIAHWSYDQWVDRLRARFSKTPTFQTAHAKLTAIRQDSKESIEEFADRVRYSSTLVYGDLGDNALAVNHFIQGLREKELLESLLNGGDQQLEYDLDYLVKRLREATDRHKLLQYVQKSVRFTEPDRSVKRVTSSPEPQDERYRDRDRDRSRRSESDRSQSRSPDTRSRDRKRFSGNYSGSSPGYRDSKQPQANASLERALNVSPRSAESAGKTGVTRSVSLERIDKIMAKLEEILQAKTNQPRVDRCHRCGATDHFIRNCPVKSPDRSRPPAGRETVSQSGPNSPSQSNYQGARR